MAPRVAVTLCDHDKRRCHVARDQYLAAIRGAGGEPIAVAPRYAAPTAFDALLLTGGDDIDPARYAEENTASTGIEAERDALELELLASALERDLPVLGICRGLQLLNVHAGGSLEQHREGHSAKYPPEGVAVPDDPAGPLAVQHRATPAAGSLLAEACGSGPFLVNSSHHQVITPDRLAPTLRPTVEVDGIVEAAELPAKRWVVAVQWHPERTAQVSPEATRIFGAFVRAAERVPAR